MKREFLLKALGQIDDDLICEANAKNNPIERKPFAKNKIWRTLGSVAAAIVLVCGVWTAIEMGGLNVAMEKSDSNYAPDTAHPTEVEKADANGKHYYTADGQYTANNAADTESALDTSTDLWYEINTDVWFFLCKDGVWTEEKITYRDGIPSAEMIAAAYLTRVGAAAKCLSVIVETVGEKDTVIGEVIVHEVGVRTAHVTLEGDLTDDQLRGLVATIGNLTAVHYVRPITVDGVLYPLDGQSPAEGYKANAWRK